MTFWMMIVGTVLVSLGISFSYLAFRVPHYFNFTAEWPSTKSFLFGCFVTFVCMGAIAFFLNTVNAIICTLYFSLILLSFDVIFGLIQKIAHLTFKHYYAGWVALMTTIFVLGLGWYLNHTVFQTNYFLTTSKKVPDLRIALIADAHLGTTFDASGFEKHLQKIQSQNPDMLVVVGDYVDDSTAKKEMILATKALGQMKTKYGVYFVFGNHDKGYYNPAFSSQELMTELTKNKVKVLRDETLLIDNSFYLIGRRDVSERTRQGTPRKTMTELTSNLDKSKYMIVLDHQPRDYKKQADSAVDLVLSGHTHGGQLFPFNWVGQWIGANDATYGYEKRNKTDFIVTSGISDWALQFKTGTKSEFVLITIKQQR